MLEKPVICYFDNKFPHTDWLNFNKIKSREITDYQSYRAANNTSKPTNQTYQMIKTIRPEILAVEPELQADGLKND